MSEVGTRWRWAGTLFWLAAAALSAIAVYLTRVATVEQPNPIDRAVTVVAIAITFLAWLVRDTAWFATVHSAVLLLLASTVAFPDERIRLFAYGLVFAIAFCGAIVAVEEMTFARGGSFVIAGLVLLRWIALRDGRPLREALVAVGALAVLLAFRSRIGPLAILTALVAALATPAIPMRTLAIPFLIAIAAAVLQLHRLRILDVPSLAALAVMLTLFPWSGVVARGLPFFWRMHPPPERQVIGTSLAPGESLAIDLPPNANALVASGANAARLRPGTIVGRIDPGAIPIRIGEIADWGYMRREQFFSSRNSVPRDPAGMIRDYGYNAWVDGAGRLALPRGVRTIRVTAERGLPADVRLQVDFVEVER